jgi:cysteine-rich repeat protein
MSHRCSIRASLIALALLVSLAFAPLAHATCGDGAWEPPAEQCDDGNTVSGDMCSATCTLELPASCAVVSAAQYEAAHGADPSFQALRAVADGTGYNPALASPVRCVAQDNIEIYLAVLFHDSGASAPGLIIRSRPDLPEQFRHVLYRQVSATDHRIVFAGGALKFDTTLNPDVSTLSVLDGAGAVSAPMLPSKGVPLSTCQQLADLQDACLMRNGLAENYWAVFGWPGAVLAFSAAELTGWQCTQFMTSIVNSVMQCNHPLGDACRTAACHQGACHLVANDQTGAVVWSCSTTGGYLCDGGCTSCDPVNGCVSTCSGNCQKCENGMCTTTLPVPPASVPKWAKVWINSKTGPQCSCGSVDCNVLASSSVGWRYYPCDNSPPVYHVGYCSGGETGSCPDQDGCGVFASCNPDVLNGIAWGKLNACIYNCQGGGNGCQGGGANLAWGPLKLGAVLDLRTDEEIAAKCCWVKP